MAEWIVDIGDGNPHIKKMTELVRCKDCKWCVEHYDTDGNAPYWVCRIWDCGTDYDGFCYEAEKKVTNNEQNKSDLPDQ